MRKLAAVLCAAGLLLAASQLPASAQLIIGNNALQLADTQDTASASLGLAPYQLMTDYDMFFNPASTLDTGSVYGEVLQGAGQTWGGAAFKAPAGRLGFFANRPLSRTANGANVAGFAQRIGTSLEAWTAAELQSCDLNADGDCADAGETFYTPGTQGGAGGTVTGMPASGLAPAAYNQRFDALYAIPMGDNVGFGARFSFLRFSEGDPYTNNTGAVQGTVDSSRLSQELQVALGAFWKGDGMAERADATVEIMKPTLDNKYTTVDNTNTDRTDLTLKDDSALNFGLGVRGVWKGWEDNKIVTSARFNRFNASSILTEKRDDNTATAALDTDRSFLNEDKGSRYSVDAVLHTQPNDALKVFYGVGIVGRDFDRDLTRSDILAATTQKDSQPEKSFSVPLNLAFQHQTFKRLITRFGVAHNLLNNADVDRIDRDNAGAVETERKTTQASLGNTQVSFGLGIMPMEKAIIDLGVTTANLGAGFATANLIGRATLKYSF